MIVHEEFDIALHAPNGGSCDFCDADAHHGVFIKDDHGMLVFNHPNLCQAHALFYMMRALVQGMAAIRNL